MTATATVHATPGTSVPRPFRVVSRRRDTSDTFTLVLEPVRGRGLSFAAGQFTMLSAFGVGEVPISVSGDPTRHGPLMHTVRDVGAVTHALVSAGRGTCSGCAGRSAGAGRLPTARAATS